MPSFGIKKWCGSRTKQIYFDSTHFLVFLHLDTLDLHTTSKDDEGFLDIGYDLADVKSLVIDIQTCSNAQLRLSSPGHNDTVEFTIENMQSGRSKVEVRCVIYFFS